MATSIKICSINSCNSKIHGRGWCSHHYNKWYEFGDPETTRIVGRIKFTELEIIDSFISKINKNGPIPENNPKLGPCWLWTGGLNPKKYGTFSKHGKTASAHKTSYEFFIGPVAKGLQLDHLCRVRHCVNPKHLEPVTGKVNQNRGLVNQNKYRTHCPEGHKYDYTNPKTGWRRCSICFNKNRQQWRLNRKQQGLRSS